VSIERAYGYFPGGDYDPRKFKPDRETNTPDEIAAWERLCAAWDAGCSSVVFAPGMHGDGFRCGSPLGLGSYEIEIPDDWNGDDGDGEQLPVEAAEVA
jgi:hypothetical protein